MGSKAKPRQQSVRRRTWGMRMAIWSALLVGAIGIIVYVLTADGGGGDGGSASRFEPIHMFETADYHSLAFSPADEGVLYFGHHNGLQVSEDGGSVWKKAVDEDGWDAMNVVFDPLSPGTAYMSGHGIFQRSEDGGTTWEAISSNLPSLDLHTLAIAANGRLYAVPAGFGLYVSEDGGEAWRLLSDVPQGTAAIQELPDGTLLLGAVDAGILRSEDGGKTWVPSRSGIDSGVIFTIRTDPQAERIYAGTNRGLFVSTDGGRTWTATALDDTLALVVGVNPSNPLEVLVVNGQGQLYRSRDGGRTWG